MRVTCIASTTMGFESVLGNELKQLGMDDVKVMNTKVEFKGDWVDVCRANIWLRSAGRVYIKCAEFKATTFDELYEKTREINWENWIQKEDQFPVANASSRKSALFSKSDCQAIVKKAIVDRLKAKHRITFLAERAAKVPIRIQIENDIVILSIDSSGEGLNKRGYRAHMSKAPLRETLAAGIVLLSRWRPEEDVLLDPFCGTGTLLIEAGLMAKNCAPGINRSFSSEQWAAIPKSAWQSAREEAKSAVKQSVKYRIYGSDHDPKAISIAQKNIELAGLNDIFIQKRDIKEVASRFDKGRIITNPPYGERIQTVQEAEILIQQMGNVFLSRFPQWSYYILSAHESFENLFGKSATKNRKLYNGGLKCWLYQYYGSPAKSTHDRYKRGG